MKKNHEKSKKAQQKGKNKEILVTEAEVDKRRRLKKHEKEANEEGRKRRKEE